MKPGLLIIGGLVGVALAVWLREGHEQVAVDELFNQTRSFDPGAHLAAGNKPRRTR